MKDPNETRRTYSEAMSDWAAANHAERDFLSRSKRSLLQPDPLSSVGGRIFGYFWRLAVLLVVLAGAWYLLLRGHLRGESFSRKIAEVVAADLHASSAELGSLTWRGDIAGARVFTAVGGDASFFRALQAERIEFPLPLKTLFSEHWSLRRLKIDELRAELRSGGLGAPEVQLSAEEKQELPPGLQGLPSTEIQTELDPVKAHEQQQKDKRALDLRLMKDGFELFPQVRGISFEEVLVATSHLTWGLSEATRGSLQGASVRARPTPSGAWEMLVEGGKWQQNWLREVGIRRLLAAYTGEALEFQDAELQVGDGGARLTGQISIEQNPRVALELSAMQMPLHAFLEEPLAGWMNAWVSGPIRLGGSLNLASGVETDAEVKVDRAALRRVPILSTLGAVTARSRFRDLEFDGGTLRFKTAGGRLEVTSFELSSKGEILLRGSFEVERGLFSGNCDLGIPPDHAARIPETVRQQFFRPGERGLLWMSIPLEGPASNLTSELANQLAAAERNAPRQR